MQHNILITSAGKRVALTKCVTETLKRFYPRAKVFTTDMNPMMASAGYVSDRCFKVPKVSDEHYTDLLLNLCLENNVGMIIPTIDTELQVLSRVKSIFKEHDVYIVVGDENFIGCCRDKRNTNTFFEQHGIRVPKAIDKYHPSFPMFAKPYDGSLSANIHNLFSPDELTSEILNDPKLLFMEYIDKNLYKEFTVDMYYGRDNQVKCIIPRERIEIRAGEISKGRTVKNEIVPFLKSRLSQIDGCVGCVCLQLFFNSDKKDIVGIEINPRFGGGYPLSYKSGGNYPEYLIREYFAEEEISYTEDWKDNLLMLRYDEAIFV